MSFMDDNTQVMSKELIDQLAAEATKQDLQEIRTARLLYNNDTEPKFPSSMTTMSREYRRLAWTPVSFCSMIVDKIASMLYSRTVKRTTGNEALDKAYEAGPWRQMARLMLRTSKVASLAGYAVIRLRPIYPTGIAYATLGMGDASPILDPDDPHGPPVGMYYDYIDEPIMSQLSRSMGGISEMTHVREIITRHIRDKDGMIVSPGLHGRVENGELVDTDDEGFNLLGDYLDCILWRGTDHPMAGCGQSDILPLLNTLTALNETMTDAHELVVWNLWPMLATDDKNADIKYSPRSVILLGENAKSDPASIKRIEWGGKEMSAWEIFYEKLTSALHESSRVPAIATGASAEQIGNASSGRAYEIMMTPLLELTREKETVAIEQEKWLMEVTLAMMAYYSKVNEFMESNPFSSIPQPNAMKIHATLLDSSVEFAPVKLPKDKTAEAQIRSTLRGAGLESTEKGIRTLHPDWTDDQVKVELEKVGADTPETVNASANLRIKTAQEKLNAEVE